MTGLKNKHVYSVLLPLVLIIFASIIFVGCSGENSIAKKRISQVLADRDGGIHGSDYYKIETIEKINDTTFKCTYSNTIEDNYYKFTYKFYFSKDLSKITNEEMLSWAHKKGDGEWSVY